MATQGQLMTRTRDINRVRLRREAQGLLVIELAQKIKRSAAFVSMVEGGYVPAPGRRSQIAGVLESKPEDLWPEEYA